MIVNGLNCNYIGDCCNGSNSAFEADSTGSAPVSPVMSCSGISGYYRKNDATRKPKAISK